MHGRAQYILGPQTAAFEVEFAHEVGGSNAFAVGTGTGTAALELCLRDAGIGLGGGKPTDEVIIPSMTSLFTAQAVLAAGARIRVADVSAANLLLTPETVERAFTPATRAVIAVHLYGQPCDVAALSELCERRGVVLIQDACQAHGAMWRGAHLTAFSPYCAYSFYPTKNLGCLGDGGAVVTNDAEVASRLRLLRDGGRMGDQRCRGPAVNSRLDEIQACYLRAFLPYLRAWNGRRREQAAIYAERLTRVRDLRLVGWDSDSVHHLCVLRSARRDQLREFLAGKGIQTAIHYPVAIQDQPGLQSFATWAETPLHGAQAAAEVLSIPLGPHLSNEEIYRVAAAVEAFQ
ncbi:MAG: DegT/DnrJ/EryC1/StrS family aminotransferase [Bryobacterales bacterium]|nr:DegT/DnrJ/EryC1/StrS family aminotransferase [Bryobacterales bacterium]